MWLRHFAGTQCRNCAYPSVVCAVIVAVSPVSSRLMGNDTGMVCPRNVKSPSARYAPVFINQIRSELCGWELLGLQNILPPKASDVTEPSFRESIAISTVTLPASAWFGVKVDDRSPSFKRALYVCSKLAYGDTDMPFLHRPLDCVRFVGL